MPPRRPVVLSAGLAAVLGLAACSGGGGGQDPAADGGSSGPVTLTMTFWGSEDRATRYTEALDLFESEHPDITVNETFAAWADYWPARATEAAGRALPDVIQSDVSYLQEYGGQGSFLDLAPYLEDGTIDLEGWDEKLVEAGTVDGRQVGIPTSTNTLAIFLNPDVAAAAGVPLPTGDLTWDDLHAFITEVSASGATTAEGQPLYGGPDTGANFEYFTLWMVQNGDGPFAEDGSPLFDEADIVEFLERTADLRASGSVFPAARATALAPKTGFGANEQAADFTWDNFLAQHTNDSGKTNLEMMPVPVADDGERHMFWKPSMLLSAGGNTEHPAEAAVLIDFLLTDPRVGEIFGTSKGVPADPEQRDAVVTEEGSIDAKVLAYEEAVADEVTADTPVYPEGIGTLTQTWTKLAEELNYGNITPEDFAAQFFAELQL
ncbi:ABC transporter substrate-binding protein [Cellulomonas endophytica]|uniref:ABC transporter substrate-binding protein n=1 Tax=Cellulomonas endophytica TaxID=2494735 RepID=UPI00101335F6|nr:extracellular solute-binding protein [Cellulomonas endophytica]